jgi:asparagine synthetase B (glutamine-hydrolysing)
VARGGVEVEQAARAHPLRLTDLELSAGFVCDDGGYQGLPVVEQELTPLDAFELAVIPALERPPCLVGFSGGRDSSAVLAAAARAARREGLDLPIPITLRFRDAPGAEESEWQELIIRHLSLSEWDVREVGDDTDFIGPLSTAVLRRHGVLFPPNVFIQRLLLEPAAGGSLLTGNGGDHVFAGWRRHSLPDLFAARRRPAPRDVLRLAYASSPRAFRRRVESRRQLDSMPSWLRPEARQAAAALAASEQAEAPLRWREWVRWLAPRRELAVGPWSLGLMAADEDVVATHPFLDPRFLAAMANAGGSLGFGDRTAAMRALFSDVLPDELNARSTKARGNEIYWRSHSREFARSWDGVGVDHDLVDPMALREEWLKPSPRAQSAIPLQAAWLASEAD